MAVQTMPGVTLKRSEHFVYWLTRHWLAAFNIVWGAFVITPFLAPVFMQAGATGLGNGIYFFYQFFCHQLPERSFFLFGPRPMYPLSEIVTVTRSVDPIVLRQFIGGSEWGWKVAYSDRMVSMYTGFWSAALVFGLLRRRIRPLPLWGFLLFCLPMALDGGTHLLSDLQAGTNFGTGFRDTNTWLMQLTNKTLPATFYAGDALGSFNSTLRLLTGIIFGVGTVWFAFPYVDAAFHEVREELDEKIRRRGNEQHALN
ncbi:MAG TPA: DUF2085 domain-containing protein [Anaerolineae bacterium]|nr:DUF2085 domain-containing protein [Anaerolineae bacterium]